MKLLIVLFISFYFKSSSATNWPNSTSTPPAPPAPPAPSAPAPPASQTTDRPLGSGYAMSIASSDADPNTFIINTIDSSGIAQILKMRRVIRQSPSQRVNRPMKLSQALNMIEANNMRECVARVVCELICNPDRHGPNGRRLHNLLQRFQNERGPEENRILYYRNAAVNGDSFRPECNQCLRKYNLCRSNTRQLITIASRFNIEQ